MLVTVVAIFGAIGLFAVATLQPSAPKTLAAAVAGDTNLTMSGMGAIASSSFLTPNEAALSADIQQVDNINLDTSFLNSPAFSTFTNYLVPSVTEPIGRPNPFAPIGIYTITSSSSPALH